MFVLKLEITIMTNASVDYISLQDQLLNFRQKTATMYRLPLEVLVDCSWMLAL